MGLHADVEQPLPGRGAIERKLDPIRPCRDRAAEIVLSLPAGARVVTRILIDDAEPGTLCE